MEVADGSRAHILLNEGADKELSFVPGSDFRHATPPNREIYTERPGRTHESAGVSRSSVERNDAHAQQKDQFVRTLIAFLKENLETSIAGFSWRLPRSSAIFASISTRRSKMRWRPNWRRT